MYTGFDADHPFIFMIKQNTKIFFAGTYTCSECLKSYPMESETSSKDNQLSTIHWPLEICFK